MSSNTRSLESLAFAITIIIIVGLTLYFSANQQAIGQTTAGLVTGGSAKTCPFEINYARQASVVAPSCDDSAAIAQADAEAWAECIAVANAYKCPLQCPVQSSIKVTNPMHPIADNNPNIQIVVPLDQPVHPCYPQPDGTVIINAFAFCGVRCEGGFIVPSTGLGQTVSIAPEDQ
ncbi:MAG: hypothetical protein IPJ89_03425 [Candidatus Iainarchaeum archaeon]|uniref:Uncharacterized protein n=1 Tax=Candidatus Iainarchaeum sp. TaxID=3101447 RepID=A0A7T9DJ57_9ARCH|nr:MAG: hypothetical protein IPJ89_03425 [Candidatus Diapherotrites archaeon]